MPIRVPDQLPATEILQAEGVDIISTTRAQRQDIRPLSIAILNLMPLKIQTETQLARALGMSPLQVDLTLLSTASYQPKNTSEAHLQQFYLTHDDVKDQRFDGLIITGAPIETMPFEEVHYWPEMAEVFEWARRNVFSTFAICWGAQAALYHYHGVQKHELAEKCFGVFDHSNLVPSAPLLRGMSDQFPIPVSRHTEVRSAEIPGDQGLRILAESAESGLCLLDELAAHRFYMFNHLEYDARTLDAEYKRDVASGAAIAVPANYYPGDDPSRPPVNRWRSHSQMLFGNWIDYVYQNTPYDWVYDGQVD